MNNKEKWPQDTSLRHTYRDFSGVKKTCSPEGRIKRANGPHYNNNRPTNASAALQRYILEASIRTMVGANGWLPSGLWAINRP